MWRTRNLTSLRAAAVLALAVGMAAAEPSPPSPPAAAAPPYLRRGDEVEARDRGYRERLERFFERFGASLERDAPDLFARLAEAPPRAVPYGYGILPRVVPDPPRPEQPARVISASFSWARVDGFIGRGLEKLDRLEGRLEASRRLPAAERRSEWERMVEEYRTLAANRKLIENNIQYNRLWQGEIARNRRAYDEYTAMHDAVLQRQAVVDVLEWGDRVLDPYLRAREEELADRIRRGLPAASPPDFLSVAHPDAHHWIVRVPMYTDIEDQTFLDGFSAAVQSAWRVRDGEDEFRAAVEIHHVPLSQLYPEGGQPAHGEHIDLWAHISRFPPGAAVLTTGANTTHVLTRAINVGPHDIAPNVLAHEFGHLLGFPDRYFRGYRDRGPDGFEVLEVVLDPDDIMSAPGAGRVHRAHFEELLDARQLRR
ncbi:MAG TPA: hypothetical protein VEL75_11900 [Candidatus Methylomirabilis sp.]|nr:hypothetical protein [Candidatus Methylomirabilis sp.]